MLKHDKKLAKLWRKAKKTKKDGFVTTKDKEFTKALIDKTKEDIK